MSTSPTAFDVHRPLRFSTRFRSTIYSVMLERGWEDANDSNDFDLAWLTKEEISVFYELQMRRGRQFLINHFSSHQMLTRKDMLAQNVQKYYKAKLR